jgi:hypothetical protein
MFNAWRARACVVADGAETLTTLVREYARHAWPEGESRHATDLWFSSALEDGRRFPYDTVRNSTGLHDMAWRGVLGGMIDILGPA